MLVGIKKTALSRNYVELGGFDPPTADLSCGFRTCMGVISCLQGLASLRRGTVVGVATPAGWPATLPPSSSSLLDSSRQSLGIISSRFLAHGACWILAPKSDCQTHDHTLHTRTLKKAIVRHTTRMFARASISVKYPLMSTSSSSAPSVCASCLDVDGRDGVRHPWPSQPTCSSCRRAWQNGAPVRADSGWTRFWEGA